MLKFDAFVSYCHAQKDIAVSVKSDLIDRYGLTVWFDNDQLDPTATLYSSLQRGVELSKYIICFISSEYDDSPNCVREITFATNCKKPLIILMFTEHSQLRNLGLLIAPEFRINVYTDLEDFKQRKGNSYNSMLRALYDVIGKPLQLVQRIANSNKMVLKPEALDIIKNIDNNIGVCVVVGPYRQGKSFLMNRLINCRKPFKLGHTDISCTKGIWLWSVPIRVRSDYGEISVLFMDTEGLESSDASEEWDKKLFILSYLMSSYFIYNKMSPIDRQSLSALAAVTSLSETIQYGECSDDFPDLMFVARDFRLIQTMTSDQMLGSFLDLETNSGKAAQERNAIRGQIKKSFRSVKCCYLPTPEVSNGKSIAENLKMIETFPWSAINENFRNAMDDLSNKIRDRMQIKRINQQPINGPMFVQLLRDFVNCLNDNKKILMNNSATLAYNIAFKDELIYGFLKTVETHKFKIINCRKFAYGIDREAIDYHIRFCIMNYPQVPSELWRQIFSNNNDSVNWPSIFRKPDKTRRDEEIIQKFVGRWRKTDPLISSELINMIIRSLPAEFGLWRWPYYARVFFACEYRDYMQEYLLDYPDLIIEPGFVVYFNDAPADSFETIKC